MLIKIIFVDELCGCVGLYQRDAGAQPYGLQLNTPTAMAPPTVNTHLDTHTQIQAVGSGVMVSPLSTVCLCVCSCNMFKCVLVEPAVTSLQDTAGHNSR